MGRQLGGSTCWFSGCRKPGTSLGSGDPLLPDGMAACPEHREEIEWLRDAHRSFVEVTGDRTGTYSVRVLRQPHLEPRMWAEYVRSWESDGHTVAASTHPFHLWTIGSPDGGEIICSCGWRGQLTAWIKHARAPSRWRPRRGRFSCQRRSRLVERRREGD
jgi:hypothetical protein